MLKFWTQTKHLSSIGDETMHRHNGQSVLKRWHTVQYIRKYNGNTTITASVCRQEQNLKNSLHSSQSIAKETPRWESAKHSACETFIQSSNEHLIIRWTSDGWRDRWACKLLFLLALTCRRAANWCCGLYLLCVRAGGMTMTSGLNSKARWINKRD